MPDRPPPHDLSEKIAALLEQGVSVTDDVMHAIDATFSAHNAGELIGILSDPSNCEADAIFELIFYPDQTFQETIEPFLMARSFAPEDVELIVRSLALKNLTVTVLLPHGRGLMKVPVTESILRQLVLRLNIERQIDLRLVSALARGVTEPAYHMRLRVFLRNCRREFSDAALDFLRSWIEKMYAKSPHFEKAFRFLLEFFDYATPETDIYQLLMKEKGALVQQIARAEKCEAALQTHHVEALMLRGMPILCVDIDDIRKKIVLIDHICLSMFGKTEMLDHPDIIERAIPSAD